MGNPNFDLAAWTWFVVAFAYTFWQPSRFYQAKTWSSDWYIQITRNTSILSADFNLFVPFAWFVVFATSATSWFLFGEGKENEGAAYDEIMGLILATITMTKIWIVLVYYIAWVGIFAWASAPIFALALTTWILMFAYLGDTPTDTAILVLWAPIVLWTGFATFVLGTFIWIQNAGVRFPSWEANARSKTGARRKRSDDETAPLVS